MSKKSFNTKIINITLIKTLITILVLSINSGLVYSFLVIVSTTYFKDIGLQISIIGFTSIKIMPYSLKYLWSPFIENNRINFFRQNFDTKQSCILYAQLFLMIFIGFFGYIPIEGNIFLLTLYLLIIGFFGATHDIAMEAYRIEMFLTKKLGVGNIIAVYGFKVGFIISGVFCLYLSTKIDWKYVFIILSLFIFLCMLVTYYSQHKSEYKVLKDSKNDKKIYCLDNLIESLKMLVSIPRFRLIIILIAFYKASDAYLDTLSIPFLLEIGFSKNEIAGTAKLFGLIGVIIGTFIGGLLVSKISLKYSLFSAEVLSSITNLQFFILLKIKTNLLLLGVINLIESISYGISNIVLMTYMSSLCHKQYAATHYALLISLSSFTRALLAPTSGIIVQKFGWQNFFILSSLFSIPSLLCIFILYFYKKQNYK